MNCFRPKSACGRIRAILADRLCPPDTASIAVAAGLDRHYVSRLLCRMHTMGYVRRVSRATVGRYATAATWAVVQEGQR